MFPIILQTNYFILSTFWLFVAAAIIICSYLLIKIGSKSGLKIQFLNQNAWQFLLWGLLCGRIISIAANYQLYFTELSLQPIFNILSFWDKGFNFWGIVLGSLIALYFTAKREEQNFWKWLDLLAPIIIIGVAIGSLGAFFEGINYGRESNLPWAVNFESPSIRYTVPIHPSQIYAFLYAMIIGISMLLLRDHKKNLEMDKPGFIGLISIVIFALCKFLEEFTRGDETITILSTRVPQIISLITLISAGIFLHLRYNSLRPVTKKKIKS